MAIPDHLPPKMSISCWIWSWITSAAPGEPFADLEKAVAGLRERGFNAIRIEAGPNWCFNLDGSPRGVMEFRPWVAHPTTNLGDARHGGSHDVLKRVIRLFELARKYDIFVILSSWDYQDSTLFVADPAIRAQVLSVPPRGRLMHLARQNDRLLDILKQKKLERQIAFVEVHNEIEFSEFCREGSPCSGHASQSEIDDFLASAPPMSDMQALCEESIGWLRQRHPDLLVTCDFSVSAATPANAQVYDKHVYMSGLVFELYRQTVWNVDFDPSNFQRSPLLAHLLKKEILPYEVLAKAMDTAKDFWKLQFWLLENVDNTKHDAWLREHLREWEPVMRETARRFMLNDAAQARRLGLPAVLDECGMFIRPWGSRFEESPDGRRIFEYVTDCAIAGGYWGHMPTTYSSPCWPAWTEYGDWLKEINTRFQNSVQREKVEFDFSEASEAPRDKRDLELEACRACGFRTISGLPMNPTRIEGNLRLPSRWTVFTPFSQQDPLPDVSQLTSIPRSLKLGNSLVEGRELDVRDNRLDFAPLWGGVIPKTNAYVYIRFVAPASGRYTFGFGADWWHKAWIDGEPVSDTLATGNGEAGFAITNHMKTIELNKGEHLLTVRLIGGMGGAALHLAGPDDLRAAIG